MMPRKPSGGEQYWRRYAAERHLGPPCSVEQREHGYRIAWPDHTVSVPFVGGIRKLRRLVDDLQRWIANG